MSNPTIWQGMNDAISEITGIGRAISQVLPDASKAGVMVFKEVATSDAPVWLGLYQDGFYDEPGDVTQNSAQHALSNSQFYGHFLEDGTSRMTARRPIQKAAIKGREAIGDAITNTVNRHIAQVIG